MELHLIKIDLLADYLQKVDSLEDKFVSLKDSETSTQIFDFYASVSAMASSKIEGETMEIDSFVKYKMLNIEYVKDLTKKPNDLYNAYLFAQKNRLTDISFLKTHSIITTHLLTTTKRGKYRTVDMLVMQHNTGRIQFEAVGWNEVSPLIDKLWSDISTLLQKSLSVEEVFYFASYIHLVFVNIHPFEDGNGRTGRLLEKWFIAEKLGKKAWFLQSELNYYRNVNDYYKNLNRLGIFYQKLDYSKALPFLLMLPKALNI